MITIVGELVDIAPMYGCVARTSESFVRILQRNPATKKQCVKINARGEYVWLHA